MSGKKKTEEEKICGSFDKSRKKLDDLRRSLEKLRQNPEHQKEKYILHLKINEALDKACDKFNAELKKWEEIFKKK